MNASSMKVTIKNPLGKEIPVTVNLETGTASASIGGKTVALSIGKDISPDVVWRGALNELKTLQAQLATKDSTILNLVKSLESLSKTGEGQLRDEHGPIYGFINGHPNRNPYIKVIKRSEWTEKTIDEVIRPWAEAMYQRWLAEKNITK